MLNHTSLNLFDYRNCIFKRDFIRETIKSIEVSLIMQHQKSIIVSTAQIERPLHWKVQK